MLILAIDGALGRCSAAIVADNQLLASALEDGARGHAAILPLMVQRVLADSGVTAAGLDGIAVTIGPGSFTGLRAALALAHGLALGGGGRLVGVTVGEALSQALPATRPVWSAIDSHRGRVFLEIAGAVQSLGIGDLPRPAGPVAIAGDAAQAVACRLAARGADVMLTRARLPLPLHIAEVGARRLAGDLPPRAAQPLYVDPPATRLPATPPRPPPA